LKEHPEPKILHAIAQRLPMRIPHTGTAVVAGGDRPSVAAIGGNGRSVAAVSVAATDVAPAA
jgi:hypothetical protein